MADGKLCYVIVVDKDGDGESTSFWYTQSVLQSVLQLLGCKVHHAVKISRKVFDTLEMENLFKAIGAMEKETFSKSLREFESIQGLKNMKLDLLEMGDKGLLQSTKSKDFERYKNQVSVMVDRMRFVDCICKSLEKYRYVGPSQRDDIFLACRLRERKESVTVLLCGTSGCGKSTLSSILASRLGITTVISTDSIRHMMRSFVTADENPLLWSSTYHAGEFLDPVAVATAKAKKNAKISSAHATLSKKSVIMERNNISAEDILGENLEDSFYGKKDALYYPSTEQIGPKKLAIEGYKAQSEMVIDKLDRLITAWEGRKESVVVEGVHLSLNFVMNLMKTHPSIIPFLIYIGNEEKHLERFAIRAKYMTIDPSKNKYVKYIKNIRTIQDYLCKRAEKHLVPKVNNTNVDRSVASIHSTIFSCLRRRQAGCPLHDVATNTVKVINEEYSRHCDSNKIGSKGMFRMIQRQGSFRRYMAIVNEDGSVSKAWPFTGVDNSSQINSSIGSNITVGLPIYRPMKVHEAGRVNVQFGKFGIASWPNDMEGSSHNSRSDVDEETSTYSSSTSSPLHLNGHEKELIEEQAVLESEEEQFDEEENNSSDANNEFDDEIGGSVAESSGRSDDEYDEYKGERSGINNQIPEGNGLPKRLPRTVSMVPSRTSGRKSYTRVNSLPLRRSFSSKLKSVTPVEEEVDESAAEECLPLFHS